LTVLRAKIGALTEELQQKEETRREARDALRASERAISEANRSLSVLAAENRALQPVVAPGGRAPRHRKLAEGAPGRHRAHADGAPCGRTARRPARRAVGRGPAALARALYYTGYVSRAAASMLVAYRAESRRPSASRARPRTSGAAARGGAGEPRRP